jgi:hypothetical protein
MMSMSCNCCVRELLILARTWFAFGLPSKTGCDNDPGGKEPDKMSRLAAAATLAGLCVQVRRLGK